MKRWFRRRARNHSPTGQDAAAAGPADTPRRSRVTLVGTSNGVMRAGYAHVLREERRFERFANLSLGLSSHLVYAYRAEAEALASSDVVVLDFCCNDASLHLAGHHDLPEIERFLLFALADVQARGALPVILIYPIRACMPDGGPVAALYRDVAARYAIPVLDCYGLLGRALAGMPDADVFADDMHVKPKVARALGTLLTERVTAVLAQPRPAGRPIAVAGFAYRLDPAAWPGGTTTRRGSSLVSLDVHDYPASQHRVSLAPDEAVVGVLCDFGRSCCVLRIAGADEARIRLSTEHYASPPGRFVAGIWPLHPPVRPRDDAVVVAVTPDALEGSLCGGGPVVTAPPVAALAGLFTRRPARLILRRNTAAELAEPDVADLQEACRVGLTVEEAVLTGLYNALLGREPDDGAMLAYGTLLQHADLKDGLAAVARDIVRSPEFAARFRALEG